MEKVDLIIEKMTENYSIPHILFHGEINSGKRKLVDYLLNKLYEDEDKKLYCMSIECSTCKGIKIIRDDIKEFAKQQISNRILFKSIILYDADNLTIDAQYSLRRCIEIYSKNTRFFIVTSNKDKLLSPICSRFVHVYIPKPDNIKLNTPLLTNYQKKFMKDPDNLTLAIKLYHKGVSGDMLLNYFKKKDNFIEFSFYYEQKCNGLKNELWIIYYILDFFRKKVD
jgi:DNA polymerase III delta prime subunit